MTISVTLLSSFPAATWPSPLFCAPPKSFLVIPQGLLLHAQETDLYPLPLLYALRTTSLPCSHLRPWLAARSPTLWSQEVALCPLGSSHSPSGPAPPVNIQQTLVLLLSYTTSPSPHWYCVPTSWTFPRSQRLWSPFTSIFKHWYHPEWLLLNDSAEGTGFLNNPVPLSFMGNSTSSMPPQPLMDIYCPILTIFCLDSNIPSSPLLTFPSSVLSITVFSSPLTSWLCPNLLALSCVLLPSLISLDAWALHFSNTLTNTLHSLSTAKSWQNSNPRTAQLFTQQWALKNQSTVGKCHTPEGIGAGEWERAEGSEGPQHCTALPPHCPSCSSHTPPLIFQVIPRFQTSNHPPPFSTDNPPSDLTKLQKPIYENGITLLTTQITCIFTHLSFHLRPTSPTSALGIQPFWLPWESSAPQDPLFSATRSFCWLLNRLKFSVETKINKSTSSSLTQQFSLLPSLPFPPFPLRTKF